MATSATPSRDTKPDGGRSASAWVTEIEAALRREETWRERAKKVVQRYRDERDSTRGTGLDVHVNILWSNTETLKPALYGRTAKPDVRRRFPDAGPRKANDTARMTAEVLERSLDWCIDCEDVDTPIGRSIDDLLLPGRGVAWVVYEPEIEGDDGPAVEGSEAGGSQGYGGGDIAEAAGRDAGYLESDAGGPQGMGGGSGPDVGGATGAGMGNEAPRITSPEAPRIASQRLRIEHVYWEDFCHGLSRDWKRVPWVARRHALRKDEFEKQYPEAVVLRGQEATYELLDASGKSGVTSSESEKFVEIWEIWDKVSFQRIYVAKGYRDALKTDDDPYVLEGFFPCPEPLYSVTTTDRMIPEPEFLQYQDQANELDVISTRIMRLTDMLKWNGVYDASSPDNEVLKDLASAGDGEFLAHKGFNALKDKGGFNAAYGVRPIELIEPVIASLDKRRQALVQIIYEVTGISDIMRGSTDPQETKGAQQLKAQFGSMRLQKRQRDVQRFIRDLYRIMAEIIAEHFTPEQLAMMTSMDLPTKEEKAAAQMKIAMMGSPDALSQGQQPPAGGPAQPFAGGAPASMGMAA